MNQPRPTRLTAQGEATRDRILRASADAFGTHGYANTTLDEIAAAVGITKGAVLRHFSSKEQLFVATYKFVMIDNRGWLDVDQDILDRGFFAVLEHWLSSTSQRSEDSLPLRMYFLGKDGSHSTQHAINRFLRSEDPDRTMEFVEFGMECGEISRDHDPLLVAAMLDWAIDGYQASAFAEDFDRSGLFRRAARGETPEVATALIDMLRRAFG